MYNEFDQARLEQIHAILMELGSGNFMPRLETTDLNNDIETLVSLVNTAMDKVSTFFHHHGYVNQTEIYNYQVQSFFILDNEDIIIAFNSDVKKLLLFKDNELRAKPFYSFLTDKSKFSWDLLKMNLSLKDRTLNNEFIVLSFITKQDSIFIMNCLVDKIIDKIGKPEGIMVMAVTIEKDSEKRKSELRIKVIARKDKEAANDAPTIRLKKYELILKSGDIRKIERVHEYIRKNHFNDPLLSLKKLAESFGLNEYRLKHGFKQLYGQSTCVFIKNERLSMAVQLVIVSTISFKTIFKVTGFKHASHFTMAFKRIYGLTPKDMRKLAYGDITFTRKV